MFLLKTIPSKSDNPNAIFVPISNINYFYSIYYYSMSESLI